MEATEPTDTVPAEIAGGADRGFSDVDRSSFAAQLAEYLERVAARADVRGWQALSADLLGLTAGARLLDVGCGLGTVSRELARRVVPAGAVVAVDVSEFMVTEAARRHDPALPVTYEVADVMALPYPDESFDTVRCERVLQHLADPDGALREMARVTLPGGRVCVLDSDWATLALDVDDDALVEQVVGHFHSKVEQPRLRRSLRRRFVRAGLTDVQVRPMPFLFTELADLAEIFPIFDERIPPETEMVPVDVRDAWFAALRRADAAGELIVAAVGFVVAGTKPGA
jgi:ubiquinone/menaquinone biosynthesis C-methylase UbiE